MSPSNKDILDRILDLTNEAYIAIDENGIIQIYNKNAKKLFGLSSTERVEHKSGQIRKGDIVIIADNKLGDDDGDLDHTQLKKLGVNNNTIQKNDALILFGAFEDNNILPKYQVLKNPGSKENFQYADIFQSEHIEVNMDFKRKRINITVLEENYYLDFHNAIGHMVIIDGMTHEIKFIQDLGYTARGESISEILNRKKYMAKGKDVPEINVLGQHIYTFHKNNAIIDQFYEVAKGANYHYENRYEEINGFPTLCSLYPIDIDHSQIKALLKIEDITEMNRISEERNYLSEKLNATSKKIYREDTLNRLFPNLSGNSLAVQSIKSNALEASQNLYPVIVLGERGVGKSVLARNIHNASQNACEPFIKFEYDKSNSNPNEILFGSAKNDTNGLLYQSSGGTLYIENIDQLPIRTQFLLSRAIENKYYYKTDSKIELPLNTRIVASSSKNLEDEIINGNFEENLYYHLQRNSIWIPPLRQRMEDFEMISDDLMQEICREYRINEKFISPEAILLLKRYDWPGNIKELKTILSSAIQKTEKNIIMVHELQSLLPNYVNPTKYDVTLKEFIENQERAFLKDKLNQYGGDKKRMAKELNMSKTSLYEKIKKYSI